MKIAIFAYTKAIHMKRLFLFIAALAGMVSCSGSIPADKAIKSVKSYGFVDLEGAKCSAVIIEYDRNVKAGSVTPETFEIVDYTLLQEQKNGFDRVIETDKDDVSGNEGAITKVYVNTEPATSSDGGSSSGRYVVIEVNTDYVLSTANLSYTTAMLAGARQVLPIRVAGGTVDPSDSLFTNYKEVEREMCGRKMTEYETDKGGIILYEFAPGSGWTLHRIGEDAFQAKHCYSEYTGEYVDFELPYALYVPNNLEELDSTVPFVLHMEHAGANQSDPMAGITSSRAAVKHAERGAIVLVPQIEESRRTTNDLVASSEALTAIWELTDSLLARYKGYIDESRIYGTGQSMGGMAILDMSAMRDNFFGGVVATGAQWSNNYDKLYQNGGDRTPETDPVSFNGWGLDRDNWRNWYYMVSDDNILVQTCTADPMAYGEWKYAAEYYAAAGVTIPYDEWDPFLPVPDQEARAKAVVLQCSMNPGGGIAWVGFTRGNHMATWKYGYQLDYSFDWLYAQRRETAMDRGKIDQLKQPWKGRDRMGRILPGSGTAGLNSAQFTPHGESEEFTEGWKPSAR